MTKIDKLQNCSGCEQNFYNNHNPYNVKECWHLESAKLILRRRVRMDEIPPWKAKPEKLFNCYQQNGYIFVKPNIKK